MSAAGETIGAQLRRERERQGMTVQKAADELRLDATVITALESDSYEQSVPVVYARGHLRKYARLLGVALDDSQLAPLPPRAAQAPAAPLPPLGSGGARPMRIAPRAQALPLAQIAIAAGILCVLLLFWWSPWKRQVTVQAAVAHTVAASAAADAAGVVAPPASGADDGAVEGGELVNASALADPTPSPAPARGAAPSAQPPAEATAAAPGAALAGDAGGDARVSLRLTFSATSWIDVRDATGRRLFVGHGYVNTLRSLAGRAPLTVRIGYIGGVRVEINDREVSIDRSLRSGDIARFLAGADGLPHPLPGKLPASG